MVNKNKTNVTKSSASFPPVVAVLGHVDHGKTSLLDAIRKTNIAEREHGGITQRIGASRIEISHEGKRRSITFIDTPGHEAFSRMRGRGVIASDIAILVVSSSEGVMPQTKESIKLLLEAKIPFIATLTKADLPTKNSERAKQQLLKEGVLLEGMGGDIPFIEVSAKTGQNIQELLDLILLVWDMKGGSPDSEKDDFEGVIIESKLDIKAGPRATLVVKKGTLSVRDEIATDDQSGKVKTLVDDKGKMISQAAVGEAVEVLGFEEVPLVGSVVRKRIREKSTEKKIVSQSFSTSSLKPEKPLFSIVVVADTEGSLEAITNSLSGLIHIASVKTGEISEADVLLAKSMGAIIVGFNARIRKEVMQLAVVEKVLVKNYSIIYELINELQDVLQGKQLALVEKILGKAKILASFPFEKALVLGIAVLQGRIAKGDKVRLMRGEDAVGETSVVSMRQGKNPVSKVEEGQEAGIMISPFLDFAIGDMVVSHA